MSNHSLDTDLFHLIVFGQMRIRILLVFMCTITKSSVGGSPFLPFTGHSPSIVALRTLTRSNDGPLSNVRVVSIPLINLENKVSPLSPVLGPM